MIDSKEPLSDLDGLQKKIDEAQSLHGLRNNGTHGKRQSHGVGQAMQVGIELVAGVGIGCFIGYGLDQWLGTMPLFFIICLLLGFVAGFKNLVKRAQAGVDE